MTRALFATAGLLVLAFVWGILPFLGAPPFSAHMMMHMALVVIAAPLFAVAIAGSRIDPVTRAPRLCSAIVASMLELVLVWAWHAPLLHHAARHHGWARALEQASFLAAGFFLWIAALGGGAPVRRERATAGITGLLLTSMHMTLLGALLVLGHRALFAHHGAASGLSAVHDQQLGGAIMLVAGGSAYFGGALWLVADLLRSTSESPYEEMA